MAGDRKMDAVLAVLGRRKCYTWRHLSMLMLGILPSSIHMLSIVFLGKPVDYQCAGPVQAANASRGGVFSAMPVYEARLGSGNFSQGSLSQTSEASSVFGPGTMTSVVAEWNLVCGRASLVDLLQTLLAGGTMAGALVFPALADRFGRKPVYLACNLLLLATAIAAALVPDFVTFAVIRFLMGAFQHGSHLSGTVFAAEILTSERRSLGLGLLSFMWTLALVLVAPIAYLMRNCSWRFLQLALSAFSLPSLALYWVIDESPRWLAANGKATKLERLLKKAAKMNGVDEERVMQAYRDRVLPGISLRPILGRRRQQQQQQQASIAQEATSAVDSTDTTILTPSSEEEEDHDIGLRPPRYTILDMFKRRQLVATVLIFCFMWMANSLTYYGLFLTSGRLTENLYLDFFLNALVEFPSAPAAFVFIDRLGRRRCCMLFQSLASVTLISSVLLREFAGAENGVASIVLALIGKFAISTSFASIHLYTTEVFPTNLRIFGLGIASAAARLGAMVAPFSNSLGRTVAWGPGVLFGCCCLMATLLVPCLPETKGRELPQRLEDMTSWRRQPEAKKPKKRSFARIVTQIAEQSGVKDMNRVNVMFYEADAEFYESV